MLKYYNYLYYRFYLLFVNRKSDYVEAKWSAMTLIAILISFDLSILLSKSDLLTNVHVLFKDHVTFYSTIILLIFNYFNFIYKDKYLKIVEYYKNESEYQIKKGKVIAWVIICFTCSLILYVIWSK